MPLRSLTVRFSLIFACSMVADAAALGAQSTSFLAMREAAAPKRAAGVAGIRLPSPLSAPFVFDAPKSSLGNGQKFVILGSAAFVGGLLIGDRAGRAIAVAGLAVGITGLYLWLN